MPGTLTLRIVTPERIVLEQQVDEVIATSIDGQLAILPEHEPLVTALSIDTLHYRHGKEEDIVAVMGGILEVKNNQVTVLSDAAELDTEIEVERAKVAKEKAEAEKLQKTDKLDVYVAEMALSRAIARLKATELRQARKRKM